MTILVTGATGNVGSAVARELHANGDRVRAFVRDPSRARERLPESVELAVGDFDSPDSVRRALEDVDRVFLASGDGPRKVAHEITVIDAARAAGVSLVVKASTWFAEAGSTLPGLDWNGRIEDHLRASGVPAVNLRSSFYMTNLLAAAEQVRATGKLLGPAGDRGVAMIDRQDIAAVATVVLTSDGHAGRSYVLTGPEAVTYHQVAEALSAAAGRPVEYVDVPPDVAREGLAHSGMPSWLVEHLDGAFTRIRRGEFEHVTDTVRVLTGRDPRTFAEFAHEHAGLFGAAAPAPTYQGANR